MNAIASHVQGEVPAPRRRVRFLPLVLTRYVLWEIAGPAALAVVVIGFLGIAQELQERSAVLPLTYVTWWDIARLVVFFSPALIVFIVPITYMMGILLAFGRLAQHNEITAMKASGIPLKRLVFPVAVVGALLSVGCFYLQDRVQPQAYKKATDLLYSELPQRITLNILPAGVMNQIGGVRVYFQSRDKESKTLLDIVVVVPEGGRDVMYYADGAQFIESSEGARLVLRNGYRVEPSKDGDIRAFDFAEAEVPLRAAIRRAPPGLRNAMTLRELLVAEKVAAERFKRYPSRSSDENLRKVRWDIGERFSLPFACLAVSFAAAPLAVRAPRAGRSYSFAIGFLLVAIFYLLRLVLEPSSVRSLATTVGLSMVPDVVLCAIGLWATWRVDRV